MFGHRVGVTRSTCALLSVLDVQPSLLEEIISHQKEDVKLQRIRQNLEKGKSPGLWWMSMVC